MGNKNKYVLKASEFIIFPEDENNLWEGDWIIQLTDETDKEIGRVTFAGEKFRGTIPIHIELKEKYRNHGYGTDVLKMMVYWAFLHRNIYEIRANCDHENSSAICSMEKAGFIYRDKDGREEYYSITKPKSDWTGVYVVIGILIGMIFAIIFKHIWVGFIMGFLGSIVIGVIMDAKESSERENVTGAEDTKDYK